MARQATSETRTNRMENNTSGDAASGVPARLAGTNNSSGAANAVLSPVSENVRPARAAMTGAARKNTTNSETKSRICAIGAGWFTR